MLDCFDYDGCDLSEARRRWMIFPRLIEEEERNFRRTALLSYDDIPYFRLEKDEIGGRMKVSAQSQYHGLYVLRGAGTIRFGGKEEKLFPGVQYFVPANAETYTIQCERDQIELLRYEGPKQ